MGRPGRRRASSSRAAAKWLDVRLPSEFENFQLDDALNVPLYFIRLKLKTLDPNVHYVVCLRHRPAQLRGCLTSCPNGASTRTCLKGGMTGNRARAGADTKSG